MVFKIKHFTILIILFLSITSLINSSIINASERKNSSINTNSTPVISETEIVAITSITPTSVSITPLPVETLKQQKNPHGIVVLSAYIIKDGKKQPYQGTFSICGQNILPLPILDGNPMSAQIDIWRPFFCNSIQTSNGGHGMIRLAPGYYRMGYQYYCPPGERCPMENSQSMPIIIDSWNYNPSNFWLDQAKVVEVKATKQELQLQTILNKK